MPWYGSQEFINRCPRYCLWLGDCPPNELRKMPECMKRETYNVGIYCRLSNDDERDGESASIENQRLLLQRYVRERGWTEIDTYIDDGYSGTNFAGVR